MAKQRVKFTFTEELTGNHHLKLAKEFDVVTNTPSCGRYG
jgi:hypothetical protein